MTERANHGLDRRRLLTMLGLSAAAYGTGLRPGRAGAAIPPVRRLSFYNIHTDETLAAVYWEQGHHIPDSLTAIHYMLRDFRTGEVRAIDPSLLDLMHDLTRAMDYERPIHVISGYRSPSTNAMLAARSSKVAKNSYHVRGMAIDVRLPGRRLEDVQGAALTLRRGGVGYYQKSDFVHVDTGPVRMW